jgi:hypothetical protein
MRRIPKWRPRSYIDETNDELIRRHVIGERMTAAELWSITDLHEYHSSGISIVDIARRLPECDLVSSRSYCFWGELESDLPSRYRKIEHELIARKAQNGCRSGALWVRKGTSPIS